MATIIDALVVTLGLDPRGFQRGARGTEETTARLRADAERTRKNFEQMGAQIASAINSARNAAIGLFAVFTAGRGISQFTRETTAANAELGRTAAALRINTAALSAWEGVSQRAGNAAGVATQGMQALQDTQQQWLVNRVPVPQIFRNLGVRFGDTNPDTGEITQRRPEALYEDFITALSRQPIERRGTIAATANVPGAERIAALPAAERARLFAEQRQNGVVSERAGRGRHPTAARVPRS